MARAAKEALRELVFFVGSQAYAFVVHRNDHLLIFNLCSNLNGRRGQREFCGVGDDLAERLLDQHRINVDERQISGKIEIDAAIGMAKTGPFDRRIDEVSRVCPIAMTEKTL